ncbi:hypothetical protein AB0L59_07465 [Streptomyces sp. NPDC052109]|uniref:hypothetical protein n=1 Tax=Streptomyces sp. NPDC052109 TaxID=3155527 RepID=UPI00343B0140
MAVSGHSGARRQELVSECSLKAPVRAGVAVPAPVGGELSLNVRASARWRIAARAEAELPLAGRGTEVVLRDGASRAFESDQHDGGRFAVHLLTPDLRTGRSPAAGRGRALLHLAAPCASRASEPPLDTPKGGHPEG